jgi:hypothetical protein
MSTQLIGVSISGICKRYLVDPPSMIWPSSIVTVSLFNTIHSPETSGTQRLSSISRRRFFTYVFVGYFFYSQLVPFNLSAYLWVLTFLLDFFPSYLLTALSSFSWVCWIAPNNVKLNQMFGVKHGLAMGLLTFDWGQITAFTGSPLATPWWAAANTGISIVIFSWILVPIIYVSPMRRAFRFFTVTTSPQYTNAWYSGFLPLVSSKLFDNTGSQYNVSRIINPDNFTFNIDAYKTYSPLFFSATFAISHGLSFASVTSVLTHTLVYHHKHIWNRDHLQHDIHARLMSVYKGVPDWWYLIIFCASTRE